MESQEPAPVSPTVTKEKWAAHARSKLSRGYVLILGKERKNANFHHPAKGYETCPYKIALRLIQEGIVEPAGRKHHLGEVYVLAANAAPPPPPPVVDDDEDDEDVATPVTELNDLLDQINVEDDALDEAEENDEEDETLT
jgi:hypothetical protein